MHFIGTRASGRTGSNFLRGESGIFFNKTVRFWPEMNKIDGFKPIFTIFGLYEYYIYYLRAVSQLFVYLHHH